MIRPATAPTAPPTAAPRAAPCPPAAAAPIAAPLPAPMRPPPTKRCTGSYGLVQADRPRISPVATTPGMICDLMTERPTSAAPHGKAKCRRMTRCDATAVCHFWKPRVQRLPKAHNFHAHGRSLGARAGANQPRTGRRCSSPCPRTPYAPGRAVPVEIGASPRPELQRLLPERPVPERCVETCSYSEPG